MAVNRNANKALAKQQSLLLSLLSQDNKQVWDRLNQMLKSLTTNRIARLLESSPPNSRRVIWELLDEERGAKVLGHLRDEFRTVFLEEMESREVASIVQNMQTDDLVDILQRLPATISTEVMKSMSAQDRARVERVRDYPADTAGGLTNTDVITVRVSLHIDSVIRYLRRQKELPPGTDQLFVVNKQDRYLGTLAINRLITAGDVSTVRGLMSTSMPAIDAMTPLEGIVNLFNDNNLVSMPVVDDKNTLLGRITVDDVLNVVRREADHLVLGRVGLGAIEEEDVYAPVRKILPKRILWLSINLATALIAAASISFFEGALREVVTLAFLMPVVASMGGIAGTQILTLMERGSARGNINPHNLPWFLRREMTLSALAGLLFALVVTAIAYLWFNDVQIGYLLAVALFINLAVAAIAGVGLPHVLRLIGVDPAVAGSVILTTITDVVGFATFLGLATLVYL
jgi:magnesium transporter